MHAPVQASCPSAHPGYCYQARSDNQSPPLIGSTKTLATGPLSSETAVASNRPDKIAFFLFATGSILLMLSISTSLWDGIPCRAAPTSWSCVVEPLKGLGCRHLGQARLGAAISRTRRFRKPPETAYCEKATRLGVSVYWLVRLVALQRDITRT